MVARFDGRNPRAEQWLKDQSSRLVTEILDETREAARAALVDGMEAGQNPRVTALSIVGRIDRATGRRVGGIIGLTTQQVGWRDAALQELRDPERMGNYFTRKARDRRFDRTVSKAMREGRAVPMEEARRIVARYEDRLLKYRGDVIARTETHRALNASLQEGLLQLVDQGKLQRDQVKMVWDATGDSRTRPSHMAAEGQEIEIGGTFTVGGAQLRYPGDPMGPPQETIQCRCVMRPKIDFFAGLT